MILWGGLMLCLGGLYATVPPSPDQSQFDWMAFAAIHRQPYYVGSFDMNWPGAMWLHEIGIRLFGVHPWTWHLTDFLILIVFTFGGSRFLARAGWPSAAVAFLFLYPPLYVTAGGWMAGQRDIIAAGFLLLACALSLPGGRHEATTAILAGACVAYAVLIRPTYLSFLVGLIALEALPLKVPAPHRCSPPERAIRFVVGFALVIAAAIAFGQLVGNLDDWYQQSIQFSLSAYVGDPPQDWRATLKMLFVDSWHWITVLAVPGLVFWIWRDGLSYALVLVLGLAATVVVSFAAQNKGFGYHLGGLLPILVLLMAITLDGFLARRQRLPKGAGRAVATAMLVLVIALASAGTAIKLCKLARESYPIARADFGLQDSRGLTEDERRQIVAELKRDDDPAATVAIYGLDYQLAYRAQRLPNYRFFTPAADQIGPEFELYEPWMQEIDANLTTNPPGYVIINKNFLKDIEAISEDDPASQPILKRLIEHLKTGYAPVFENEQLTVYKASS